MKRIQSEPVKTIRAYKLFVVDERFPQGLFSKYIGNEEIRIGEWFDAEIGEAGPSEGYVRGKKGGKYAQRPGYHLCQYPVATHIGEKVGKSVTYRRPNEVWAEVEMAADIDWQPEAAKRAETGKNGKERQWTACLKDRIPENGFYRFRTNTSANADVDWYIAGAMKVVRLLSDEEVSRINKEAGLSDLPRREDQPFVPEKYGFEPFPEKACSLTMKM